MLDKRITFEDEYLSVEHGMVTYYFVGPRELLGGEYLDADASVISVECPVDKQESRYADVEISPVYGGPDYDWIDVNLPYEEIDALIALAHKSRKET